MGKPVKDLGSAGPHRTAGMCKGSARRGAVSSLGFALAPFERFERRPKFFQHFLLLENLLPKLLCIDASSLGHCTRLLRDTALRFDLVA